jgi:hypothetical protein
MATLRSDRNLSNRPSPGPGWRAVPISPGARYDSPSSGGRPVPIPNAGFRMGKGTNSITTFAHAAEPIFWETVAALGLPPLSDPVTMTLRVIRSDEAE